MTMQQYCLRWNNHQPNFISVFSSLLNSESLVDVTLAAEGKHLQAHKVVLSACSSYFQSLFTINPCQHPIVILKDVKFLDLKVMVDFMYYGEVNVSQEQLPYILKTAEMLKIKGLAEIPVEQTLSKTHSTSMEKTELHTAQESNWTDGVPMQSSTPSPCPLSPGSRRKRLRKLSSGSGSGERTEQLETQGNEMLLSQNVGNILGSVIKSDPGGYSSDSSNLGHKTKQHSGESDLQRGSSHESGESETLHQITLQVPQHQQQEIGHGLETDPPSEIPGSSASSQQQSALDKATVDQILQQNQPPMGTKRGRFLMRQPRIKRESDSSQPSDGDSACLHYLNVPHSARVERQYSDPLPTISPPPGNLLAVPGAVLVKQHSHPLLPSQVHQWGFSLFRLLCTSSWCPTLLQRVALREPSVQWLLSATRRLESCRELTQLRLEMFDRATVQCPVQVQRSVATIAGTLWTIMAGFCGAKPSTTVQSARRICASSPVFRSTTKDTVYRRLILPL
ncbi:protein tramtrack, beta isoform isoform X3 [Dendroctonus ponderosae]|uniref:protein tramtrack, beta isoform isoform X3 n=1 Tax=Dendroctonus ponderosae TaxID=77166 RepID=UPI0020358E7A|nr:protein tramtrack, beta isoform isoform X3 [Dendroctonus ponderosae]